MAPRKPEGSQTYGCSEHTGRGWGMLCKFYRQNSPLKVVFHLDFQVCTIYLHKRFLCFGSIFKKMESFLREI